MDGGGLARALLLLKVMESSECPAAELAKACRIENALVASGASLSAVVRDAISTGAARIPSLLTSTELGIVVLCATLLLLRPAAPAEKLLESR